MSYHRDHHYIQHWDWAPWALDADCRELTADTAAWDYRVDLDDMTDSAQVLDWLVQVGGKNWAKEALPGLIRALNDIFALQAHYCPSGKNVSQTHDWVRGQVADFAERALS